MWRSWKFQLFVCFFFFFFFHVLYSNLNFRCFSTKNAICHDMEDNFERGKIFVINHPTMFKTLFLKLLFAVKSKSGIKMLVNLSLLDIIDPKNATLFIRDQLQGPGGTHIFGRTGMCRSNGSLFHKKSLNMGPVFYQKILKHGSTFLTEPKFLGFRKPRKSRNFWKMGLLFKKNP